MADATKTQTRAKGNRQVKVTVDAGIASAFKAACAAADVSMAGELSQFMAGYAKTRVAKQKAPGGYSTKRRRRAGVKAILEQMERIRACEEDYLSRIPENLQGSMVYDKAEEDAAALEEAIGLLESTWMVP